MISHQKISEYRPLRLKELEDFIIGFSFTSFSVGEQLRQLPRTGKLVRLNKIKYSIKVRTVYDHICSLFDSAEILLPYFEDINVEEISYYIAYHDINEILIGDMPEYTQSLPAQYDTVWRILARTPKETRELTTDNFLRLFADTAQKKGIDIASNLKTKNWEVFHFFDIIDPIIAIWRYCYNYRDSIDGSILVDTFMDFFNYPNLHKIISNCSQLDIVDFLTTLANPQKAIDYCHRIPFEKLCSNPKSCEFFKYLVEEKPLFYQ